MEVPLLRKHVEVLQKMGTQGMSSDESDHEEVVNDPILGSRTPQYRVLLPKWRSTELRAWLRIFDQIHMIERRSHGSLRGDFPRLRIHDSGSPCYSTRQTYVNHLPRNAYDSAWLASRTRVVPTEDYTFSHHNELFG